MKRVWFAYTPDAIGKYRARDFYDHCKDELLASDIELHIGTRLNMEEDWHAIILQRVVQPTWLDTFVAIQNAGCKVCINMDDDIFAIPKWNPAYPAFGQIQRDTLSHTCSIADMVIVSTEPLKRVMSAHCHESKIRLCPNLYDWTEYNLQPHTDPVKILYTGSVHHEKDLDEIVVPLERIMKKWGKRIQLLFMGALPRQLSNYERIVGSNMARMVPKQDIGYIAPVELSSYPATLCNIAPDIALCPLCDDRFNDSKCIVGDSLVATTKGIKPIADIREGRVVLEDGRRRRIVNNFKYDNVSTVRITTKLGYSLEGTPDHRIQDAIGEWTALEKFYVGNRVKISPFKIRQPYYQHLSYPLFQMRSVRDNVEELLSNPEMLPRIVVNEDWGRLFGYIIGDGHLGKSWVGISCSTDYPDVIEDVKLLMSGIGFNVVESKKSPSTKGAWSKGVDILAPGKHLVDMLRHYGFSNDRGKVFSIPPVIFNSPQSVIREFIRGLFESDGTCQSTGVSFTSKSYNLAKQVQIVLLGFGIHSNLAARHNKHYRRDYYTINLGREASDIFQARINFISQVKQDRLALITGKKHSNAFKLFDWTDEVVKVEEGHADVYDIEVEEDHYYIANGFVSHNSMNKAAECALAGAAIIATDLPPYRDVEHARLIKCGDEDAWYSEIDTMIGSKTYRQYKASYTRQWILDNWTWQGSKRNMWLSAIRELCD